MRRIGVPCARNLFKLREMGAFPTMHEYYNCVATDEFQFINRCTD